MDQKKIGSFLKELRKEKDITQEQLAEKIKVSGRMGKVLIWFVIIISTVVLYCLMKVKAESDELYEKLVRKHFYGRSDDIPASDKTEHLKGCG
mgnify:FL=1